MRHLIFIVFFATILNIIGFQLNMYDRFFWYDKAIHALNSGILAYITIYVFYRYIPSFPGQHRYFYLTWVIFFIMTIGVLWEYIEWGWDIYMSPISQTIKGKEDTLLDLAANTTGAIVALLFAQKHSQPNS